MISPEPSPSDPIRVLVVDDSAIIRGFVARALEELDDVVIVASVANGQGGVHFVERDLADIIILDIEMPVMDGLTAIPLLLKASPWSRIIMSSTLTRQGAEISLRALSLGAADYVAKPSSTREAETTDLWKHDLLTKVHALGTAAWRERRRLGKTTPLPPTAAERMSALQSAHAKTSPQTLPSSTDAAGLRSPLPGTKTSTGLGASIGGVLAEPPRGKLYEGKEVRLQPIGRMFMPDVIAIGSSTGGPQALFQVLPHLRGLNQPILITQHMPRTFTTLLAEHITRQAGLPCAEGQDGERLVGGRAYLAPGDYHMLAERHGTEVRLRLTQDPPENFCRPSVDPMFRSLATAYGANKMLMAVLTGMGSDGMRGADPAVAGGGVLVAQDQKTSVVWGMPGAVATSGLCHAVLPIDEIGPWLRRKATGAAG